MISLVKTCQIELFKEVWFTAYQLYLNKAFNKVGVLAMSYVQYIQTLHSIYSEIYFEGMGQDLYLGYCFEITLLLNSFKLFNYFICITECLLCVRNSAVKAFCIVLIFFLHVGLLFKSLYKKIIPINLAVWSIVKLPI